MRQMIAPLLISAKKTRHGTLQEIVPTAIRLTVTPLLTLNRKNRAGRSCRHTAPGIAQVPCCPCMSGQGQQAQLRQT